MYISKVVKGEQAAQDLLIRMNALSDGKLHWCESFAHAGNGTTGDIVVERIWEKSPSDKYYSEYVIMYMHINEPRQGQRSSGMISVLREWAYEDIRNGKI